MTVLRQYFYYQLVYISHYEIPLSFHASNLRAPTPKDLYTFQEIAPSLALQYSSSSECITSIFRSTSFSSWANLEFSFLI